MSSAKAIHKNLEQAIDRVVFQREKYVKNPNTDFTRNRKLNMKTVIKQILSMDGGSLSKELFTFSKIYKKDVTASAFVQQRSKLSHKAFADVFKDFNKACNDREKFRGYRVFAVDGSDINCFRNPESENFISSKQHPKGFNQIHLNAIYDVCNKTYLDVCFQSRKKADERKALIDMLKSNEFIGKNLILTDRGYESYNMIAHLINTKNIDFLCRVKDGVGAMLEIAKLPMNELDLDISIEITTRQTNEDKIKGRRFIQTGSKRGKVNSKKTNISHWDFPSPYTLKFRVVRFLLDSGKYETIATSLNREEFTTQDIKELYHLRWEIETSFRDLKYKIGLINLHCKKDELILQEIYSAIIMYNYCSRLSSSASVKRVQTCKYAYKVNFTLAIHICKQFYKYISKDFKTLIYDISKNVEPIRPGRHDKRNMKSKGFVGFTYRVAA